MKIAIGCDHGAYDYKERLIIDLRALGHEVIDFGTNSKESVDYPLFARKTAEFVAKNEDSYGIVLCTSGEGVCITANKIKGIRCGLSYNDEVASLMRKHNHANMIAFGAKFLTYEDVLRQTKIFLETPNEEGRHTRRVELIEK